MRPGADLLVDVENASIAADVKRPARRIPAWRKHTVRPRHLFARIAENRIRDPQRFSEPGVGVDRIDARRKIADVQSAQLVVARTERLAFGSSTTSERLREPGQYHR